MRSLLDSTLLALVLSIAAAAQTGGNFDLSHSVIAGGGGTGSTGGQFALSGTSGQTSAGTTSTNGNFSLRGGFWAFDDLAPTAALVSVSGRVLTAGGQGIRSVQITLSGGNGVIRTVQSSAFGHFHFDEVEIGQTYILQVSSKRFVFASPIRLLTVQDRVVEENFIAENQ